jgi:hypothetical protein
MLPLAFGISAGTVAGVVVPAGQAAALAPVVSLVEAERRASLLIVRRPGEPALDAGPRRFDVSIGPLDEDAARQLVRTVLTQVAGREGLRGGAV